MQLPKKTIKRRMTADERIKEEEEARKKRKEIQEREREKRFVRRTKQKQEPKNEEEEKLVVKKVEEAKEEMGKRLLKYKKADLELLCEKVGIPLKNQKYKNKDMVNLLLEAEDSLVFLLLPFNE